ncbi:MAG: DotU family type IV/VI secretion system protein [Verrucomicrobia bacterium]|nr:DotU family type IV/VI secretion system protein [Verrucomicrobiota bacterium]
MAFNKKKKGSAGGDWGSGDDFWGAASDLPDTPPALSQTTTQYLPAAPPAVKRPLLEHLQPLFLYVCEQHRLAKEAKGSSTVAFESVKQTVLAKIAAIDNAAKYDPMLRQHLDKLKQPIYWYLDSTFGSPDNAFPFRQKWNDQRPADYGADGNLSGDDAFFDELNKELANDPKDESSNERLAFYYTALGLGFTGRYFKRNPDHRKELQAAMQRLYPRVSKYVDADASGKITPESYRYTDKRDFVAPSRDKPMIFFAAFLLLLGSLIFGYIYWYQEKTKPLREAIHRLQQQDASSKPTRSSGL